MGNHSFGKWLGIASAAAGCAFLVSIPFGSLSRFNLWRISVSGSCSELLALKKASDEKIASGETGSGMSALGEIIYNMDIVKTQEDLSKRGIDCDEEKKRQALSGLSKSIKEINRRLDEKAADLLPGEVLLWPISYAKPGDDYAWGDLRFIEPLKVLWISEDNVMVAINGYQLNDHATGKGIEESTVESSIEVDCTNEKQKKLCARLKELTRS